MLHYYFPFCATLLLPSLPCCFLLHVALLLSSSCQVVVLLFVSHCCSLFHVMLMFSSLCHVVNFLFTSYCYFPLRVVVFLFTSHCRCPLCVVVVVFLFALMFSSLPYYSFLHIVAFLFALLLSSSVVLLFQVQGFSHCYSPIRTVFVGVLLFVEESCINPLHSFLQELGMVGS